MEFASSSTAALISLLAVVVGRRAGAQCIELTEFLGTRTTFPDYDTVVYAAVSSAERLVGFSGATVIDGASSTQGSVTLVNAQQSVYSVRLCKVVFKGENDDSRVTLSFSEFNLDSSKLIIVDGMGQWRGDRILIYSGSSLPPDFVSVSSSVGIFAYYDQTVNASVTLDYSITAGTTTAATLLGQDVGMVDESIDMMMMVTMGAVMALRMLVGI